VTRPRAADDFVAIRARMEELRLERIQVTAGGKSRPRPTVINKRSLLVDNPSTPPKIRQFLLKYGRGLGKL
jgi:hypothetical protein